MKGKKNQKRGFSLIELLAVIAILGVISTITIFSIKYLKNRSRESHYDMQLSNLLSTAKLFAGDDKTKLPKNIGQTTTIYLEELINKNYIKDIKDYEKESCYIDKSYVDIFKYAKDKYTYHAYLSCPNYESETNSKYENGPKITITPFEDLEKIEFKIEARSFALAGYSTTNKILSYKYILYLKDKTTNEFIEIINSGDIEANLIESITKEVKLEGPIPSEYKLKITAVDIYGNLSTKEQIAKTEDNNAPVCGEVIGAATDDNDWSSERLVTVKCIDNESGCEKEEYTKLFDTNTKDGQIEIRDNSGLTTVCEFKVNVDKTPPTCSVSLSGITGKNGWYKEKNVTVTLTKNDSGGSGLSTEFGLAANETNYNLKTTDVQSNTSGVIWYGIVKDNAGNETVCTSENFKVDKDAPTCTVTGGSSAWISAISTEQFRNITATCSDTGGSECITLKFDKYYTDNINTTKAGALGNNNGGSVEDNAGNKTNCPANQTVKIDKTPPTCSISLSGTTGKNGWYKEKDVTVTLTKNDSGGSGLSTEFGLSPNEANYNLKATDKQGNTTGVVWYGIVKDKAGNEKICTSANFKVDKNPPICTVTGGNNNWINKTSTTTKRKITATCSDTGGSECKTASFSKEYSSNINTTKAGANGNNNGGSVEDNAGNKTNCPANQTVKIDKTPPTCTVTGGSDSWINKTSTTTKRKITATCSDTGGSNCKTTSFSTEYTTDINTTKAGAKGNNDGGSVEDNAGNKTDCPANQTVKIDKTPPTFNSKLHYCEPNETNEYYPFGYTISDNLSGIKKSSEEFYYCYNVNSGWPASCGATCGDRWGTANFTQKDDMIISAVSMYCSTHDKTNYVSAKFKVCDNAGNCTNKGTDSRPINYNWETKCGF